MNYIELINSFWRINREKHFSPTAIALYFHLLDTSNSLLWKNPFNQSNQLITGTLEISKRQLRPARQSLIDAGLIRFISGQGRNINSVYTIMEIKKGNIIAPFPELNNDSKKGNKITPLTDSSSSANDVKGTCKYTCEETNKYPTTITEKGTEKVTNKVTEKVTKVDQYNKHKHKLKQKENRKEKQPGAKAPCVCINSKKLNTKDKDDALIRSLENASLSDAVKIYKNSGSNLKPLDFYWKYILADKTLTDNSLQFGMYEFGDAIDNTAQVTQ